MNPRTCKSLLLAITPLGWLLAGVFGALACLLSGDANRHDVPAYILGALVLGLMLAAVPVAISLFVAYRAFAPDPGDKPIPGNAHAGGLSARWTVFALLCGLELLVLPLTVVAGAADDDTLLLSIPFNLAIATAALLVACIPYARRAFMALGVIHLIGIAIAAFAAAVEIESVIVSGLLLTVTSIALAAVGKRPHLPRILFGLSAVAFSMISFLIIAIGEVSQRAAEAPLFAAIVAYQILITPVGLYLLHRAFVQRQTPMRAQFGLKQMLGAMVVVCVSAAAGRLAYTVEEEPRIAVAVALGMLVLSAIVAVFAAGTWAKWAAPAPRLQDGNAA